MKLRSQAVERHISHVFSLNFQVSIHTSYDKKCMQKHRKNGRNETTTEKKWTKLKPD